LSDTNPEGDIEIEITGLRPGEKLYEELLIGENPELTDHQLIMKAHEPFFPLELLEDKLIILQKALYTKSSIEVKYLLKDLVEGYDPVTDR
jgi:FlaA1/EpsC-like NDP-sugar epimerase